MIKQIIDKAVGTVFNEHGLDQSLGAIAYSDRPDLSDFQSNGALRAAKTLKRRPRDIAEELVPSLVNTKLFSQVSVDGPGFINFILSDTFILDSLKQDGLKEDRDFVPQKIIIDYGGPNVAKPLHVGHLRSAIIGEALKRIAKALNHNVIGDIHLGDWGTPMGMLIAQLKENHPTWPYFEKEYVPDNSQIAPKISAEDLNNLYPIAAKRFKEEPEFAAKARDATAKLQAGHLGYRALWQHFIDASITSIKKDFSALDVSFDLWLGESSADEASKTLVKNLISSGVASESDGALVVNVARPEDKDELPPLILRKKDGAATYATTDLGTIAQRVKELDADRIWYVVDKRQALHFKQVFRAAAKACLIKEDCLEHIGFGTVNGPDGKPFKTRDGGVMRLGELIDASIDMAFKESGFKRETADLSTKEMVAMIAVAAIKFGDLSNSRTSDYIFNPKELVRFDGKTGPYVQYAAVRAEAVLEKTTHSDPGQKQELTAFSNPAERKLALCLLRFPEALQQSFDKRMPSDLCEYVFDLSQHFNSFYKECAILSEPDKSLRDLRVFLTQRTVDTLKKGLACLAIPLPKKMLRAAKVELG